MPREDDDFRALIEQNHLIQELVRHPGWPVYADFILAKIAAEQKSLMNGGAKDMEDYRTRTGLLRGLSFVLEAPKAVQGIVDREREARDSAA